MEKIEIAGPGFINFYLDHKWLYQVLPLGAKRGSYTERNADPKGLKVQVEFVSANPTGLYIWAMLEQP